MAGTKTWATGDVLNAADLNGFVRDQWITICTSGTRPTTSQEGRTIFETDTDRHYRWDGAAWQLVKCLGAWDTWTPSITQSATPTQVVTDGRQIKEGRRVTAKAQTSFSSAGTASNIVTFTLPYAVSTAPCAVGTFLYLDSGATFYSGTIIATAGTTAVLHTGSSADYFGIAPAVTIANADYVLVNLDYLAAS